MSFEIDSQARPAYHLLNQEQIEALHTATLEVLSSTGIRIEHPEAVALLETAGCRIQGDKIAHFPPELVENCIRSAPSSITIFNRAGQPAMTLADRNVYFGLGTDLVKTIDLETGELRGSVLQDVINASILVDACEHIDFNASYALPGDVPTNAMYIECARVEMENCTKPVFFTAAGKEDLEVIIRMAAVISGGLQELQKRPFLIHYAEPTSPLIQSFGAVQKLFTCADYGIPICYTPGALMGASAPVTMAGALVQTNAEALSSIVLHQLRRAGAPIISGLTMETFDMRTANISYGSPENRLNNSAFADLYHHYRLPMWSEVGSDAVILDEQASLEHGISILMAALDGANLIHDTAYLGQGLVGDPAMILLCDEIISYVRHILRGIRFNKETLAVDLIHQVGHGGHFLQEDHTLKHFRQEIWRPKFANRENPEVWQERGGKRFAEKIRSKTRQILESHPKPELPLESLKEIRKIAAEAAAQLQNQVFKS